MNTPSRIIFCNISPTTAFPNANELKSYFSLQWGWWLLLDLGPLSASGADLRRTRCTEVPGRRHAKGLVTTTWYVNNSIRIAQRYTRPHVSVHFQHDVTSWKPKPWIVGTGATTENKTYKILSTSVVPTLVVINWVGYLHYWNVKVNGLVYFSVPPAVLSVVQGVRHPGTGSKGAPSATRVASKESASLAAFLKALRPCCGRYWGIWRSNHWGKVNCN